MTARLFSVPDHYGKAAEKAYQQTVQKALTTFGWRWNHCYPLRTEHGWRTGTTEKGWPDLTCFRRGYVLGVEIKGFDAKGHPTPFQPGQIEWLEEFAAIPTGRAWVLRPTDHWPDTVEWLRAPETAPRRFGYQVPVSQPR
ncbi:MAG: hypothetical protein V4472_25600 [Pseudomonadota bacterium]